MTVEYKGVELDPYVIFDLLMELSMIFGLAVFAYGHGYIDGLMRNNYHATAMLPNNNLDPNVPIWVGVIWAAGFLVAMVGMAWKLYRS